MSITDNGATDGAEAPESAPTLDSIIAEAQAEFDSSEPEPDESTETEEPTDEEAPSEDESSEEPAQTFTVKVDGQDVEVSLDDLTSGYLRQSDYTRKTQALADERRRYQHFEALEHAFQTDPQGTLTDLAKALGVQLGPPEAPADDLDPDDPIARELREMREWRNQAEQRERQREAAERQAAVDRELEGVKTKFNVPQLDETALLEFALTNQIPNLELAYELMEARAARSKPSPEKKVAAKRKAPKVEGGSSRDVGVTKGASDRMSLEEALNSSLLDFQKK